MIIIKPYHTIESEIDTQYVMQLLEKAGRNCYRSDNLITENSADKFIKTIINSGHLSVLEHFSITVKLVTSRAVSHQLVRHRLSSFCLSGDTVVPSYHGENKTNYKKWTIEQLYNWQNDWKRKGKLKLINLRSVDENMVIVPNQIKQIIKSGVKDLYLVETLTGRTIKTTMEHRYYTPDGYKQLKDLAVGDKIYANGLDALENEEYLRKRYLEDNITRKELSSEIGCCEKYLYNALKKFNITKSKSNYPNRKAGRGIKGMHDKNNGRQRISERMSGENSPSWKGDNITNSGGRLRCNKLYKPDVCWGCEKTEGLERHHYDKNPKNNNAENIFFVCSCCHNAFHHSDIKTVFSDEIVSIMYFGKEDTYDIEMVNDPHNFVANGLVVHNSQESQRYCNYNKDKFNNGVTFIKPTWVIDDVIGTYDIKWAGVYGFDLDISSKIDKPTNRWLWNCAVSERDYLRLLREGWTPEQAREVLNNSTKTEIVMTANLRQWRAIFNQRCKMDAQSEIRWLLTGVLGDFNTKLPVVFGDLEY